jgi:hypothetical protein
MAKHRQTITIDLDLMNWLDSNNDNISEAINSILRKEFESNTLHKQLESIKKQRENIDRKEEEILEKLMFEGKEGTRIQREEAEQEIKENERKKKERLRILQDLYDSLKKHSRWKECINQLQNNLEDYKKAMEWVEILRNDGFEIKSVFYFRKIFSELLKEEQDD